MCSYLMQSFSTQKIISYKRATINPRGKIIMETPNRINKVKIAYFSGTGGTARVAYSIERELKARSVSVMMSGIRAGVLPSDDEEDLLVLLFAVHAFNAPEIVYQWIDSLPADRPVPVAVISVSGGGEISPNTACRLSSIRRLEKRGYGVIYERMIVMPSNWIAKTDDGLSIRLLRILPVKSRDIVDDLLAGTVRRTRPGIIDRIFSGIGELEKRGAKNIGENIRVNDNCNGCGWCSENCPANNIRMSPDRPVFGKDCLLCLKCIYGCPNKALGSGTFSFIIVKEGYDLNALEKRMDGVELVPVEELAKGYLWRGVKKYLLED